MVTDSDALDLQSDTDAVLPTSSLEDKELEQLQNSLKQLFLSSAMVLIASNFVFGLRMLIGYNYRFAWIALITTVLGVLTNFYGLWLLNHLMNKTSELSEVIKSKVSFRKPALMLFISLICCAGYTYYFQNNVSFANANNTVSVYVVNASSQIIPEVTILCNGKKKYLKDIKPQENRSVVFSRSDFPEVQALYTPQDGVERRAVSTMKSNLSMAVFRVDPDDNIIPEF